MKPLAKIRCGWWIECQSRKTRLLASLLSAQATSWRFSSKTFWPEYTLQLMNRSAEKQPQ